MAGGVTLKTDAGRLTAPSLLPIENAFPVFQAPHDRFCPTILSGHHFAAPILLGGQGLRHLAAL
jgi:hypothetical protein